MTNSPHTERFACAAPRGAAKTTWVALIFLAYCIVYHRKRFAVLITSTASLAEGLIRDLKHELEENDLLAADFPEACGRGGLWRDREVVTRNGIRVLALGAGQRIRGRRHHEHRPDLFILDDLETDEHARNPEQRDKLWNWLNKAVLKAKGIAKKADFIVIGTILHFDSVLARLLDPRKSPGWRSRKYRSVIRWSDRQDLWDQWQALYTDWRKPDERRIADADTFFHTHEKEMLRGTEVLWPEAESYYDLMKLRVDEGPTSFDSEKQNEPIDPSSCEFQEAWFQWFDEVLTGDGEIWLIPDKGDRVKLSDCDVFGATDPSMGKQDTNRDPSAIVTIAAYPARHLESGLDGYRFYFVLDAEIRRRHPYEILEAILRLHRLRRYRRHGIEAIQFQELFADDVREAAARYDDDLYVVKLKPHSDKALRIQMLSSLVYSGRLRLSRKLTELYDQLRYFPQAAHDDGPDALALCIATIKELGWEVIDISAPENPDPVLGPYDQQIRNAMPDLFDQTEFTCGDCMSCQLRPGRGLFCDWQHVAIISENDAACVNFDFDATARERIRRGGRG